MPFPGKRWQRRSIRTACALLFVFSLYHFLLLPRLLRLGTSAAEFNRTLPGDELVSSIDYKSTLAVTVRRPPSAIWPWIAQMGLNKAGFYSYTFLENVFGCNLKNADSIHAACQNPKPGYYEGVCQSAVNKGMPGWVVAIVEPHQSFVWKGQTGEWMMGVYIDSVDAHTSRVITRMLYKSPDRFTSAWWIDKLWFEWAHCVMQMGMIKGIKKRAERS